MFEVILAGNIEANRLEAEVRDERYELIAIVYEDGAGWQVEQHIPEKVTPEILGRAKELLSLRPNRKGDDLPPGMSRGEHSLWLLDN